MFRFRALGGTIPWFALFKKVGMALVYELACFFSDMEVPLSFFK